MTQKTCFFIGHHDAPADLAPVLAKEVERHITEYGVSSFITGMYGSFDQMAMRAVAAAKKQYPWVRLSLLLPYHPEERKIEKPKGVDELYYPDGLVNTPRRFAIVKANEKVIAQSDFLNHRGRFCLTSSVRNGSQLEPSETTEKVKRMARIYIKTREDMI